MAASSSSVCGAGATGSSSSCFMTAIACGGGGGGGAAFLAGTLAKKPSQRRSFSAMNHASRYGDSSAKSRSSRRLSGRCWRRRWISTASSPGSRDEGHRTPLGAQVPPAGKVHVRPRRWDAVLPKVVRQADVDVLPTLPAGQRRDAERRRRRKGTGRRRKRAGASVAGSGGRARLVVVFASPADILSWAASLGARARRWLAVARVWEEVSGCGDGDG
ncbi:hypothetical protein BRADI_2g13823v3 [Brachypodium distachyon]|uniref:Uncharacterized protein n=1 Tax=Brachypodium distachyon TaxID=15368 RepID=A0A0Q3FYM0_BRADI|nr:hypothetical protein BRADI_2g13823v3 [Brachypodium distachyon]